MSNAIIMQLQKPKQFSWLEEAAVHDLLHAFADSDLTMNGGTKEELFFSFWTLCTKISGDPTVIGRVVKTFCDHSQPASDEEVKHDEPILEMSSQEGRKTYFVAGEPKRTKMETDES
jgi:hypothetical protein